MGRGIDALLRRLARSGLRRGMSGEHWAWLVIGGAAFLLRRARRPGDKAAKVHLRSGERYVIEVRGGATGRRRTGGGSGRRERRDDARHRVIWQGDRITTTTDRPG